MALETIVPDWPAPACVRALVTTRALGDMGRGGDGRDRLRRELPAEPVWLRQVHGTAVLDADKTQRGAEPPQADASVARTSATICAVTLADCMPVLLADDSGVVVAAAHAGWRGLAAGVIEATLDAMGVAPRRVIAWLGPAIGPRSYEVGDEVRSEFIRQDPRAQSAFAPARPGHWLLDLYAVARQRFAACGVARVTGGGFCTYTESERFFSWRRERSAARMAALVWIERRVE